MLVQGSVAPDYNLIVVQDPEMMLEEASPELTGVITVTPYSILIGTTNYSDGETKVTLGHMSELKQATKPAAYTGLFKLPSCQVIVTDVYLTELLRLDVGYAETKIAIWVDHPTEPDNIVIGFEAA